MGFSYVAIFQARRLCGADLGFHSLDDDGSCRHADAWRRRIRDKRPWNDGCGCCLDGAPRLRKAAGLDRCERGNLRAAQGGTGLKISSWPSLREQPSSARRSVHTARYWLRRKNDWARVAGIESSESSRAMNPRG